MKFSFLYNLEITKTEIHLSCNYNVTFILARNLPLLKPVLPPFTFFVTLYSRSVPVLNKAEFARRKQQKFEFVHSWVR
jgi:hypothetical protein